MTTETKVNTPSVAPTISVVQASFRYEKQWLFSDLCLTIHPGEWVCLLGPSGVGKTSLLRMIAGLAVDSCKENVVQTSDGLPLTTRLSYFSQAVTLLPWLTVLDNMFISDKLRGQQQSSAEQRQNATQLLNEVGLGNALSKYPRQLSGGMKQRAVLARVLYENHPVVLMDEPFCALDAITRYQMQALAAHYLRDKTVIMVTHDPAEALRLASTIYLMSSEKPSLQSVMTLTTQPPREISDGQLVKQQVELMAKLGAFVQTFSTELG